MTLRTYFGGYPMNYNMYPFCLILISSFATFLDKARAWDTLITFILPTYYCQVLNSMCVLCPTDLIHCFIVNMHLDLLHIYHFYCFPFLFAILTFHLLQFFFPSALRISFKIFFTVENFLLVANASFLFYLKKSSFTGYRMLDRQVFFLHTLKIWLHYLLISIVSLRSCQSNYPFFEDSFSLVSFKNLLLYFFSTLLIRCVLPPARVTGSDTISFKSSTSLAL